MSRSALWRQEGAKKMREKEAEELFTLAVNEGRNNPTKGLLPIWGPDDSFHINPMLLGKIIKSSYFQKCCIDITDWNTLVDEVYYQVKNLEPWTVGEEPSNAFCLLLRLLTLRCSEKQMKLMLDHVDSPYIRGIGFLYLRFAVDPKRIWKLIEPYLYDDEPIIVAAASKKRNAQRHHQQRNETIGDFVRLLFSSDLNFYGTVLPRLPLQSERELQVKLLFAERIQDRRKKHFSNRKTMDYFQTLGSRVMALYGDEGNPIQWYEAIVDRVVTRNEKTSQQLERPKFVVTFPEYGNTESVSLGEMEMRGVTVDSVKKELPVFSGRENRHISQQNYDDTRRRTGQPRDRGHGEVGRSDYDRRGYSNSNISNRRCYERTDNEHHRGYDSSRYDGRKSHRTPTLPSGDHLYKEVRTRQRGNVTRENQAVARRPSTAKVSLTGPPPTRAPLHHGKSPPHAASASVTSSKEAPQKRSTQDIAVFQEKKRKLMAKYG